MPAQQIGASIGGTTYVIPSSTKGAQLKYAVRFLQYATSPQANQAWLNKTSGSSVIVGVKSAPGLGGFSKGNWGEPTEMSTGALNGELSPQGSTEWLQDMQGYLLGTVSLQQATEYPAQGLKGVPEVLQMSQDLRPRRWISTIPI